MRIKILILLLNLIVLSCFAQNNKKNGDLWYDTDNRLINAHGAGLLKFKDTYYLFGEFKGLGKSGNLAMDGVSCYSSKNLTDWKNEGLALKMIQDTNSMLQPGCILERPKVIYNAKNKNFVMWFHHELKGKGYSAALTGLAVSDHPNGPFQYIHSIRPHQNVWPVNLAKEFQKPLDYPFVKRSENPELWKRKVLEGMMVRRDFEIGQMSRDMTLFVDDDGKAYHVASSEDNQTLHVSLLNDDYTGFTNQYYRILEGQSNEAPAIFKRQGKYYLIASGTTGWKPNPGRSFSADNIYGPWENLGNPGKGSKEDLATTFRSQSTFVIPHPKKKDQFIYLGDRWTPEVAAEGKLIWLPLIFEQNKPIIYWEESLEKVVK